MNSLQRFFRQLWILLRRDRFNRDLDEEMAFHRQQAEEELRSEGMPDEAAREQAARQFGNATLLKEQSHDVVGFRLESVAQDFRFACRQLRKSPGFACTAVLMLGLGIGASVAIFAFVDAALIKPLPYRDPAKLVAVYESAAMIPHSNLSYQDYLDWKKLNRVTTSLEVYTGAGYSMNTAGGLQLAPGTRVSDGFFRTLGVTPILGRDFYAGEDSVAAAHAVLLSYHGWQKWFAGRRDVVGQTVTLSGLAYTVVGVLPPDFNFAPRGRSDFWATLQATGSCEKRRSCHNLNGIARLKDGISLPMAQAGFQSIAQQLEIQYPDSNHGQGAALTSLAEAVMGNVRPILLVLLGGAGLLLLIACVNVSSLLLVRSESRKREIAVRGALGASPARLIRQFVTEGFVLVAGGSMLGIAAASAAMLLLVRLIPKDMLDGMPYLEGLSLNPRVLLFAACVSMVAALLFSLTPILRLPFADVRDGLSEGNRGYAGTTWRRVGANLVILELATAVVLLVGAGLLGKSFYRLLHVELGFEPDHLATIGVMAPDVGYEKDEQVSSVAQKILTQVAALPGVKSVGITSLLPVTYNGNTTWVRFVGRPYHGEHNEVNERDVSPDFFKTIQARLVRGRYFTDADDASKPGVVVINRAMAAKYFPDQDPLGKKIGDTTLTPKSVQEIIGIVDDIKEGSLDSEIWPAVYVPSSQSPDGYFSVVVRTSQAEQSILPSLTAAIHRAAPDFATLDEATMSGRIADSPSATLHRSSAWLVGGFAGLALLLGAVGLYGVIAYSVAQRTREIGVRMALGAQRSTVYQLVLSEAWRLTVVGIAAGLLCSLAATALLRSLLFGVRFWDLPTLAAVALVLGTSALLASYIPARRAASVNPVDALRAE